MARPKKISVEEQEVAPTVVKHSKKKLISSVRFAKHRDLLNVLLKDDETYSVEETGKFINDFLAGKYTVTKK